MQITRCAASATTIDTRTTERSPTLNEIPHAAVQPAEDAASTWEPSLHGHEDAIDWRSFARTLTQLELSFDDRQRALWQYMAPDQRPSFTPDLIADMNATLDFVENAWLCCSHDEGPVAFLVLASRMPGIFNLGGDLPRFLHHIEANDADGLRRYAYACVDGQHRLAVNLGLPLCTIAVVQGDALGGGFEAALAHNVIIAERQAKFGLPEILFNLFPGMGAYTFLSRRLGPAQAERIILSGRVYTAEEMHDLGAVDILADPGEGEIACQDFITQYRRAARTRRAVFAVRQVANPISRQELFRIADLWVDCALSLDRSDLRKMQHLAKAQDRRWSKLRQAR